MSSRRTGRERSRLQELLKGKRDGLLTERDSGRLQHICETVAEAWREARPPIFFTPHDDTHCERVEERLYELLGDQGKVRSKLSDGEVFLLLASVWLHDIGMIPELLENDPKAAPGGDAAVRDMQVREEHGERSARYVRANRRSLGLTPAEGRHLQTMCRLHRHRAYVDLYREPLESEGLRVPLLTAYLRLADALHIPDKGGERDYKLYVALGMDPIARFHWLKSRYVRRISICPDDFRIRITLRRPAKAASAEDWEGRITPLKEVLEREVQDELDCVKDLLARGGLSVFLTVESHSVADRAMSAAQVNELEQLLSDIELFDARLTPNASQVVATILRQVRVFLDAASAKESVQYLREYVERVLAKILEMRPCHVFTQRIGEVLKESLRDGGITDEERVNTIRRQVDEWAAERESVLNGIAHIAYGLLHDGAPILVYGYSDSVVRCLSRLPRDKRETTEVYVAEGRTKTEYRYNNRLVYCDGIKYAEELRRIGIQKIHYVTDSCASTLFSRRKVAKVLFGANGIDKGGSVAHTLGHLAIADMAAVYHVPVYVIADSMKIGHLKVTPDLARGNQWLTRDACLELKLQGLNNFNPREDVVPPERIDAIITEKGQIRPADIARYCVN